MDRADVSRISQRLLADLVANTPTNAKEYSIRMTSGTTSGEPFLTVWRSKDASGLQSGVPRYLLAWGPRAMRLSNMLFFRNDPKNAGNLIMAADVADLEENDAHLFAEFAPTTIYGFPSFIARIAERMDADAGRTVGTIALSGEALSSGVADLFSRKFPHARVIMTWASAETGVISKLPCEYLRKNSYHPRDDITIAIEAPDEDGVGLLSIGKTLTASERIENYKTGDMARLDPEPCECGEKVTFELLGRAGYDYIKLVGAILRREEFDRVAALCAGLFEDYRVEAQEVFEGDALKGNITLKVFRGSKSVSESERLVIAETVARNVFLTPTRTLRELIDAGIFMPLSVEEQRTPFARGGKEFKLILKK